MLKNQVNYRIIVWIIALPFLFSSCYKGIEVDIVVHNARIHTMNEKDLIVEAMAIKDGKILEIGPNQQILNKYRSEKTIDAGGREIYPGLTDAHGHILAYMKQKLSVDLVGCRSYKEMIERINKYQNSKNKNIIVGRGWDQSLWGEKELPTNDKLNEMFPNIPICLYRIDGHAALVNDAMIKKAGILGSEKIDGGINTGLFLSEPRDLMVKLLSMGTSRFRESISHATRGTIFSENKFRNKTLWKHTL